VKSQKKKVVKALEKQTKVKTPEGEKKGTRTSFVPRSFWRSGANQDVKRGRMDEVLLEKEKKAA